MIISQDDSLPGNCPKAQEGSIREKKMKKMKAKFLLLKKHTIARESIQKQQKLTFRYRESNPGLSGPSRLDTFESGVCSADC
jgi:hypothetical protein